jgi:transposase
MAFSNDFRKRLYAVSKKGTLPQAEILRQFQISRSGLNHFLEHVDTTGKIEPKPHGGGRPPKFGKDDEESIKKYIEEHSDATLKEIIEYSGKDASIMALSRFLDKLGYHLKKSRYSQANKTVKMLKKKEQIGLKP